MDSRNTLSIHLEKKEGSDDAELSNVELTHSFNDDVSTTIDVTKDGEVDLTVKVKF